jgi:alpha-beta hydrolase superfamily lysophospholipase
MRLVVFFVLLLALALVGYLAIVGYFLAHTASGILRVGPLASALATAEPPEDPLALGYRGNPMQALSLPFEIVPIETPLGPAEAWLVPAPGPEIGRAIYVHGIAGAREDGYRHLSMLHQAGWSVLMISYRNDPSAPPAPEGVYGFGLLEWPDLEAAVARMSPGPDGPGLLVVAESMGGAILGQFLARSDLADRVGAIALDSPAISFSAVMGHLAQASGKPLPRPVAWVAGLLAPQMTSLPLDKAEVAPVYAAFSGPLFVAHGSGDRIVPIGPSQALAAGRSARTVTLWTEADHLGSFAADPSAYRTAFGQFLAGLPD